MEQWWSDLARDGLHRDRITIVYYCAESLSASAHWDSTISPSALTHALTTITQKNGALDGVMGPVGG